MPENKERYTPGAWKINGPYGSFKNSFRIVNSAEMTVSMAFSPDDARLIADAPAMFALLKEYLEQHTGLDGDFHCPCYQCKEARAIVVRVLGEE